MPTQPVHGDGIYQVDVSLPSSELVYGLINHDNGTGWGALTMRLSTPIINPNHEKNRNTRIFGVSRPGADVQGSSYFWYDRISLTKYLINYPVLIIKTDPSWTTTHDLIPWFNATFGLGLTKDDVRQDPLDRSPNADNWFTMSLGSLAWMDGVRVQLDVGKVNLSTLTGDPNLPVIVAKEGEGSKINGELYGYQVDTSSIGSTLSTVPITMLADDTVARALTQASGEFWGHTTTTSRRNLHSAVVTYNGPVIDQTEQVGKEGFKNVIVINTNKTYCTEFQNPLVLYYNR